MGSQPDFGFHVATRLLRSPMMGVLRYVERHWSVTTLTRLFLIFLMAGTLVIGSWLGLATSPAYAASRLQAQQTAPLVQQGSQQPSTASDYHLPYARGRSGDTVQHPRSGPGGGETNVPAILENHIASVGDQSYYTYMKWQVNDHLVVEVNVGSGNLVVHASDLHIQGTGVDLSIERFYNSMGAEAQKLVLSQRWNLSVGADVYLNTNSDGSITYFSPSGTPFTFTPNGSGGFKDPAGLNATLQANQGGDTPYHLNFHKNHETYEFGVGGHFKIDEDKNGNKVTFNQAGGVVSSITDTQGRVTNYTYDSSGRLITITDPSGRTVQYTYDANGNLASSIDALGQTTTFTYETGSDALIQINDPTTHAFKIAYSTTSSINEVSSITDTTGATTSFSYNDNDTSNTTVVTDARGNQTTYDSDPTLRVTKVTDALGHTQAKTYTPNSDVASTTDSLTNTDTFSFDANNNITSASDATGAKNTFTYQDSSHPFFPTGAQDAQGNTLGYSYDSPGNLTSVKNVTSGGAGETTNYTYNSNGTLATMKDGNGNTTTYSYDGQGNLIKVTPPSPLGPTTIVRDSLSRATSVTDGKGQATSFTYDLLDRITTVQYADGSKVSYTRSKPGNVTSQADNTGTTHFQYDAANRVRTKQLPDGTTLTMTYDAIGNLTSFTDQGGTTNYSYNAVNLVTTLTDPNGAKTTFAYDNNNRRTAVNYPNGVTISLTYDKAGHETDITTKNSSSTLSSYSYDYGGKSLRQSMTDNVLNQETEYHYDSMNRLTEAEVLDSSNTKINDFDYSYDKAGNRTSQTIGLNGTKVTLNYNTANQLTSTSQGTNYSYDANGNETTISTGNVSLVYNAKDQTTSIKGVSMNYTGTDQNQRVKAAGTSYVNAPLGISSQTDSNGQVFYTRDNQGNLVSERTSNGTFYYLFDALGSIVGLTDGSGTLVGNERYQYDPYGNLLHAPVAALLQTNPWRFAGGYFDSATGFTKFGVRYYDATVGRWTQQDPKAGSLFDARSSNRYVYAKCDPVNVVDPSGASDCFGSILSNGVGGLGSALLVAGAGASVAGAAAAIPVVGIPLAAIIAGATIYVGYRIGAYTYNLIAPDCGWPQREPWRVPFLNW